MCVVEVQADALLLLVQRSARTSAVVRGSARSECVAARNECSVLVGRWWTRRSAACGGAPTRSPDGRWSEPEECHSVALGKLPRSDFSRSNHPPRAIRSKQDCSFALLITTSRCSKGMLDICERISETFHSVVLLLHDGSLDGRPGKSLSLIDASWNTFGSHGKCFCLIYVSNVNSHNTIWLVF